MLTAPVSVCFFFFPHFADILNELLFTFVQCGFTCINQNVAFSSGRTALQMSRDLSIQLPRPDQNVARSRSKTYPKRIAQTQPAGKSWM